MSTLPGKRALITGSSQGIGKAIATALAAQGAQVYVHSAASLSKAEQVAEGIRQKGGMAHPVMGDLSKLDCANQLYQQTGDVDILVLNASVQFRNPWNRITQEEALTQLQVNFLSSLALIQRYEPAMAEKGFGRIITVGSVQQYRPHKDMLVYAASKDAQMSLVRNLAKQLAPFGITVNNVSPGVIITGRNEEALGDAGYREIVLQGIPCGFLGEPEDCNESILMLCSSGARYITGTDITVDGGMKL